jgi:hypothetical protein
MNRHVQAGPSDWPQKCRICTDVFVHDIRDWLEPSKQCHLPSLVLCILCNHVCSAVSGLTRHLFTGHIKDFRSSFSCTFCMRQEISPVPIINGAASWYTHSTVVHGEWVENWKARKEADLEDRSIRDDPAPLESDNDTRKFNTHSLKRRRSEDNSIIGGTMSNDGDGHENFEYLFLPFSDTACPAPKNYAAMPLIAIEMIDSEIERAEGAPTPPDSVPEPCSPYTTDSDITINVPDDTEGSPEPPNYPVDCILKKWKKNDFLIRWLDGSCSWVVRADILDEDLLKDFEASYLGYQKGVANVRVDKQHGRTRYRIYFEGRPAAEAVWANGKELSPVLLDSLQICRPRTRIRRRY